MYFDCKQIRFRNTPGTRLVVDQIRESLCPTRPGRTRLLARIHRLVDIESGIKPLEDAGRLEVRWPRARPVLDALFEWRAAQQVRILPAARARPVRLPPRHP